MMGRDDWLMELIPTMMAKRPIRHSTRTNGKVTSPKRKLIDPKGPVRKLITPNTMMIVPERTSMIPTLLVLLEKWTGDS